HVCESARFRAHLYLRSFPTRRSFRSSGGTATEMEPHFPTGHPTGCGCFLGASMKSTPSVGASDLTSKSSGLMLVLMGALLLWRRDRKSTRLNSSHVKISYAVFCLKKK